ncbi:uncharacterized protein LOC130166896 isoform X1 [Seriola aureovittata]|uniref:uncharacterized protein LOC130166896 isoform X1 n=1 Tax=Seriola aureovittata TaxID=2871759 RepID=UPI0024BD8A63|nr:uncharacterized protein LOC130166896 isoform X1 [Seriola aureovittata]
MNLIHCVCDGLLCMRTIDVPAKTVQQNTDATLPCPHATGSGDVTWWRVRHGEKVVLVTIKNGHKESCEERYDSPGDNSLVIRSVQVSDESMYFCNNKPIYLNVTSEPNMVAPTQGEVPVTHRDNAVGPGGSGTEDQPSHLWMIPVGSVIGGALVLVAVVTLRRCSERRRSGPDTPVTEGIYEEIEDGSLQPDVESPYYWSTVIATTDPPTPTPTPTPTNTALYSTVTKSNREGRGEEGVYSLAQNPQTDRQTDNQTDRQRDRQTDR